MRSADKPILGLQPRKSRATGSNFIRIPSWLLRTNSIAPIWSSREHGHKVSKRTAWTPAPARQLRTASTSSGGPEKASYRIAESDFGMPAFQGGTGVDATQSATSDHPPSVRREKGTITVDQARLIFAIFEVASLQNDDLVFAPADVFHFHNGSPSSGSNLRQLESALAALCDIKLSYRSLPGIGDGKGPLVSKLDTGRLSLSYNWIKGGGSALEELELAYKNGCPKRRKLWRLRLTEQGYYLLFRTFFISVNNEDIASLPRSPIARWLYLWVQSHGAHDGRIHPYRLSTIVSHAGFDRPSYDVRYNNTDTGSEVATQQVRWFNRVQRRIELYLPVAFGKVSHLCGWGALPAPGSDSVIHMLRIPTRLRDCWDKVSTRFSSSTALALLLKKVERKDPRLPGVEEPSAFDQLERWSQHVTYLARCMTGDRGAPPSALLDCELFRFSPPPA